MSPDERPTDHDDILAAARADASRAGAEFTILVYQKQARLIRAVAAWFRRQRGAGQAGELPATTVR